MNALLNRLITNATAPIGKNKRAPLQTGHALFRSHELPVRQLDISYNRSFMFVQSLARTAIAAFSAGGLYLGSLSFASPLRRATGRTMPHLPRRSLAQ
jgi:hypothetical protein